jgi:hypothetical protein
MKVSADLNIQDMALFCLVNSYQHLELDCSENGGSSLTKTSPNLPVSMATYAISSENLKSHEHPVHVWKSVASPTNIFII